MKIHLHAVYDPFPLELEGHVIAIDTKQLAEPKKSTIWMLIESFQPPLWRKTEGKAFQQDKHDSSFPLLLVARNKWWWWQSKSVFSPKLTDCSHPLLPVNIQGTLPHCRTYALPHSGERDEEWENSGEMGERSQPLFPEGSGMVQTAVVHLSPISFSGLVIAMLEKA